MWRALIIILGLIYTSLSFAQQDTIVSGDELDQEQWVHQYIVREAYKLLKAQIGYDIPVLQNHIGNSETGDMAFVPGNKVVIGAYREDEEDPVYGYYGPFGAYVTNTHFWNPDDGDGSHFCISPTNECFENAYVKASAYFYSGPIIYNYAESTNNPYWFACGAPGLITGLVFDYDNIFDFFLTGSARVLAVRNVAGNLDWCSEPVDVQWVQSFREKVSWEILGRVAHLLADVNTPAHAHYDQHWPDADTYEVTMGENNYYANWDYFDAIAQNNLYGGAINVLNKPNPLKYLFYTSAQIAGHFPSDDVSGNNNKGLNDSFTNYPPLQTIINLLGSPPSSVNVNQIANTSFVYSIRATTALLHWFSDEVGIIPPPPPVPPIISHFTQNPNPICKGGSGSVTAYLSQGYPTPTYTWAKIDGPASFEILTTTGNPCQVRYNNTGLLSPDEITDALIRCTATINGVGSYTKNYIVELVNSCPSCPTLAFEVEGEMIDDNPLLITSLSNPDVDVTDYYLVQNPITPIGNQINLRIHEPQTEHTWLDYVELIEAKVKSDELVAVNDEGEVINYSNITPPIYVFLNDTTDITEILSSMDTLDITLNEGDIITIQRNIQAPVNDGDGDLVLGGTDPIKDVESITLRLTQNEDIDGDNPKLDDLFFFFRPNKSIIAKKLRNLPPGNLEIAINQELTLNYLTLVRNLKTARVNSLSLLSANHQQAGDVKNLLLGIDQYYAEILPGEIIDFEFQKGNTPAAKTAYILKSVGRYETDTTLAFNKLTSLVQEEIIPKENKLFDNYPNPFNPATQIKYSVKENGMVTLKVYDVLGNEVATLLNEEKQAGTYTITFDAGKLASGIYFYTISANDFHQTKKMILVK